MSSAPPVIPGLRPEPKRDHYGRYLLTDPITGHTIPFTRATTLAHTLDETSALTKWKQRMVLQGAAKDPTVLATVPQLEDALKFADGDEARDLKKAIDAICELAMQTAGAGDGAGWGTALHSVTEYHDAGRLSEIEVPVDLMADLAVYEETLTRYRILRPKEHIERIVVNTTVGTAGTYDRLLRMPDGRLVVGDLKSQQKIFDWLGIAMQLAQYAYADNLIDTVTGQLLPLPPDLDMTRGLVIHIPARSGTCTLYEVDLEQGWHAAKLAAQVKDLRGKGRRMGWQWQPTTVAAVQQLSLSPGIDRVLNAIESCTSTSELTSLWRTTQHTGTWLPQHTEAAAVRKQQLAS